MSDFASSLPVRTENAGDVIAKIADATTPSQQLGVDSAGRITVKFDDGAGNIVTSQTNGTQRALDVGINVAGVQIDPRSIRALTSADVVSVVQSTSPWITKDQSDGPVAPGTAASFSSLIGGQYNTSLPVLTTGQQSALQVDSSGRLIMSPESSALLVEDHNYGTVGASTLRTASQLGNATGAADFNAGATGAQTLRVQANQGAASTAANGWFVKATDGTNSQSYLATGEAKVSVTQPLPTGTNTIGAVTQASGPWTDNLTQVGGSAISLGQKTMAASLPVVLASDQAAIPVVITSSLSGTEVNDYNTAASLAAGGTSNHDYAITSLKTFKGKMFWASASGKLKIEVQTSPDGTTFSTKWVGFNSTANPNICIQLDLLTITDTGVGSKVRIIRTNEDKQAQDVYSTISGNEI